MRSEWLQRRRHPGERANRIGLTRSPIAVGRLGEFGVHHGDQKIVLGRGLSFRSDRDLGRGGIELLRGASESLGEGSDDTIARGIEERSGRRRWIHGRMG